jgi:PIN domain nuclease of toxin-antitoxin system
VDLGLEPARQGPPPADPAAPVILLDTNALIWLAAGHRRARPLVNQSAPLRVSPASLLELQFLEESGRIRVDLDEVIADGRWKIDEPASLPWMLRAGEEQWTRDPFDRLIVAHARLRGWRLATADDDILQRLRARERLGL